MHNIVVAGIGTDVGKTVASAILATSFNADYWKPIQSGWENKDADVIRKLLGTKHRVFPSAYSLKAPLSPHHSARLENLTINPEKICLPFTKKNLVIEMAGGIFTPLNSELLSLDLFCLWNPVWVVVSRNYLGSINHTLLTVDALKRRKLPILGIVFNGDPNPDSEEVILETSGVKFLGRILPEKQIDSSVIKRYARKW